MSNLQAKGWEAAARQAEERRDRAIDDYDRLRAVNAKLVAALLPFCAEQFATPYRGNVEGDDSPVYARPPAILTIGDFRRARAALAKNAADLDATRMASGFTEALELTRKAVKP